MFKKKLLVGLPTVSRDIPGWDYVVASELQPTKADLAVFEPMFLDFKDAASESLGQAFTLPSKVDTDVFVLSVKYSRANVNIMKGWLIDLCSYHKGRGYPAFLPLHVPWESYGCPMVGSSLLLFFGRGQFVMFSPQKTNVFPRNMWPSLLHHSPSARAILGRSPGSAVMHGLVDSSSTFLPNIDLWRGPISSEVKSGDSIEVSTLGTRELWDIFGCSASKDFQSFLYCTPKALLTSMDTGLTHPPVEGDVPAQSIA